MTAATGATPLFALKGIALDAETTGLDPANARIVQLGTIPISRNTVERDNAWESIVNPGAAIPQKSTSIHGITDAMAANAPSLIQLWEPFIARLKDRVVIGHTIGFDLAVLKAEAERRHLSWHRPRALCVRMLSVIAAPDLADHSLDALAEWLGVKIENRHTALADARAAADVFLALLPRLEDRGITTLGQAERACRRLTPERERHERAGWQMPVADAAAGAHQFPIAGIDDFAFQHAVVEIMARPVIVTTPQTPLKQALDIMERKRISSVFVADHGEPDRRVEDYGIVTERDALRHISALGEAALKTRIGDIAVRPVETIREEAFVYRAIGRMARLRYRHLGVRDEAGNLTGVVSARDLMNARASPAITLDDTIEGAQSDRELAAAWSALPAVTGALIADGLDAAKLCRIISEEIRAMTRRAAMLAQDAMQKDRLGKAPCPFAVMVLGSGGRGESMLVPDQDNAVIFAEGEPGSETDNWFAELGKRMAATLDSAGVPYCDGGVMAMNAQWRGSRKTWHKRVDEWVGKSRPEDLLNVDIFFDGIPVHGDLLLGREIFAYAYARGHEDVTFAKLLGESISDVPNPFNIFGSIKTEGNRLDLKKHILFPICATARALAIRHNIARHGTRQRFDGLLAAGIGNESDFTALLEAQQLGFALVLENQSRNIEMGLAPSNEIDLGALERSEKSKLSLALKSVQSIPEIIRAAMFGGR